MEPLVKRLEVAVSRLELLSSQRPELAPKPNLGAANSSTLSAQQSMEAPPSVKQYDEAVEEPLRAFLAACSAIGGDVADMGCKVKILFDLQRNFIWSAAGQPEPSSPPALQTKLSPILQKLEDIASFKESKRNTEFFNHLSSIAEAVQAIGWLTTKPTPAPFIKDMLDAAMFYVNRVRTANKDKPAHMDWAKSICELFTSLQKYVRQAHTTGLVWNSTPGASPSEQKAGSNAAKIGGPAPPPPPPPPMGLLEDLAGKAAPADANSDRQKLFAELNKGEAITIGLRKVTADMQTHKNPGLRQGSTVPAKIGGAGAASTSAVTAAKAPTEKPPKTELKDGKVWNVEYHKGNPNIQLQTDMKQTVYIFRCENSVVQIKGKVNSVVMDGCKKTSVVFDDLLSQIEVINCQSAKVQTLGALPTISIQKTDGCQVYLSAKSLDAEIVTSKSSEMNVLTPQGEDGDFVEFPIPEQFKTTLNVAKHKLDTVVSDIC